MPSTSPLSQQTMWGPSLWTRDWRCTSRRQPVVSCPLLSTQSYIARDSVMQWSGTSLWFQTSGQALDQTNVKLLGKRGRLNQCTVCTRRSIHRLDYKYTMSYRYIEIVISDSPLHAQLSRSEFYLSVICCHSNVWTLNIILYMVYPHWLIISLITHIHWYLPATMFPRWTLAQIYSHIVCTYLAWLCIIIYVPNIIIQTYLIWKKI